MKTNIDGLYACGNATGGLQQISKAVYEGAIAGIESAKYIKNYKGN
jgi:thioredoxin reductase (NADPH)